MQLISEFTVGVTILLRSLAIVITSLVIFNQIIELQVNRLMPLKLLLTTLTIVLLVTNFLPLWYYIYFATAGAPPSSTMSEALVINNTIGVLVPGFILLVIYKMKGEV